jgi:hypothetical protein
VAKLVAHRGTESEAERAEEAIGRAENRVKYLLPASQDFRGIRGIQPLVLTEDRLPHLYG